jgi:ribosomal protein S18 acetylase RimI-like enzyme
MEDSAIENSTKPRFLEYGNVPTIEPFSEEHIDGYLIMHRRSWLNTYPNESVNLTSEQLNNILNKVSMTTRRDRVKKRILDGLTTGLDVLLIGGTVGGVTDVVMEKIDGKSYGKIRMLYLDPDLIGKGYGKLLMDHAISKLKSLGAIEFVVEVAKYNERAIKFYEKFGFGREKQIENYQLTEDILIPQIRLYKSI